MLSRVKTTLVGLERSQIQPEQDQFESIKNTLERIAILREPKKKITTR